MDIDYFMKIQNAYGTKNRREKELAKVNREMSKNFEDTFDTEDVLLNGKPFKLMIIKDTDGNTYKKKIKSKHNDKFNLGDYVEWNGQMWLITLIDSDEKTWNRGYMYQCPILLRWQNKNGDIVERWGYSEDFTKYSSGITGNDTITLGDYQYGLTLPVDNETKVVKRDARFPIDIEGVEPPDIYKLTNRKILLTDNRQFGRGGILTWTLSFSEFDKNVDKKVKLRNGSEVWICNYIDSSTSFQPQPLIPDETTDLSVATISCNGTNELKIGGNYKTLTGSFKDSTGIELSDIGCWDVITIDELLPYVEYTILDNMLKIKIRNNDFATEGKIRIVFSNKNNTVSAYYDFNIVSSI